MADETLRRAQRAARRGDREARRDWRRGQLRVAPGDVGPLLDDLQLEAWNALVTDERLEVAEQLARVLEVRRRPMDLLGVRGFGPDAAQPVARYRDRATGLVFALVPGGRFRPGVSPAQVEALRALGELDELDELELDLPPLRAEVQVRPFLCSVLPVTTGCPTMPAGIPRAGLTSVFDEGDGAATWYLREADLDAAIAALGCELPGEDQVSWAARGGRELLYPWGNDLRFEELAHSTRDWTVLELALTLPPSAVETAAWPAANGFGLLALGGPAMWCVRQGGERTAWSGAGESWPWQGPGRSTLSVIGAVHPAYEDACLRPVITLGGR